MLDGRPITRLYMWHQLINGDDNMAILAEQNVIQVAWKAPDLHTAKRIEDRMDMEDYCEVTRTGLEIECRFAPFAYDALVAFQRNVNEIESELLG